ncbi:MAG: nucleotidyltransferase family protein, partial [Clostridia bacterium]|nr:nucleotidyltransferase family protein [Clostridia bacterium]
MTVGGVIAEFNPFHLGHAKLIAALREAGVTHTVAVMSGAFVQRGEAALCDKWSRAEMALDGGVDLVLELPLPLAAAPAPRFAAGGVGTLAALGCVDKLCFGSECGDAGRLQAAVAAMTGPDFVAALKKELDRGVTLLHADGMYTMQKRPVLLCAVSKRQTADLRRIVYDA